MKLIQTPISHNCAKPRVALHAKGLDYETENISPLNRAGVWRASHQTLVPILIDGSTTVAGSTAIIRYLDERHPEPPLLPEREPQRSECIRFSDWADASFMDQSRRLAYSIFTRNSDAMAGIFAPKFPDSLTPIIGPMLGHVIRGRFTITRKRVERDSATVKLAAEEALKTLDGHDFLFGDRLSLADITLATMARPLAVAPPNVSEHPAVAELVRWTDSIVGDQYPMPRPAESAEPVRA